MAYELFLNLAQKPGRAEIDRALEGLDGLEALADFEVHEIEDVVRSPEECAEDLEFVLQAQQEFQPRYREFCEKNGLSAETQPPEPNAAARFMQEVGGYDVAVIRFPEAHEIDDEEFPDLSLDEVKASIAGAWRALVEFARQGGYRLVDPQVNDLGEFVDLRQAGKLPSAYEG